MTSQLPSLIQPAAPHAGLARRYLDAMLGGDRHGAMQLILEAAEQGVPVRELYLDVFTPVLRETGRLWQQNQLTVAEEHYCTAVTQLVISQLYPSIFSSERSGRTLVATSATGDLHEIGARMVADFFEMEGWDTHYLGANVPGGSVVSTVIERRADVLAVSATITRHVDAVAELVAALRTNEATASVRILVGGYPFNVDSDLWREIGADGHANDAQGAVHLATDLLKTADA